MSKEQEVLHFHCECGNEFETDDYLKLRGGRGAYYHTAWCPNCHDFARILVRPSERAHSYRVLLLNTGQIFSSRKACCMALGIPFEVLRPCSDGEIAEYNGLRFEAIL